MGKKAASAKSRASAEDLIEERKQRVRSIIRELKRLFPVAECALKHESAFQLLVATILSAQCT
ncbi:MAG: endonuclease III, partial [Planctomycetota bacterium]